METLGNRQTARHLYEITAQKGGWGGKIVKIEVHANTRAQANSLATKAGYVVRDVNMAG